MEVELFYFDGCPNWTVADQRLSEALTRQGRGDHSRAAQGQKPEHAELIGFTGSPTVRINDQDPFASGAEQVDLVCRVYQTPAGLSGSPTVEQFIEVLS